MRKKKPSKWQKCKVNFTISFKRACKMQQNKPYLKRI
nr:MAG TPA: hypothetical protein [Caudoviricetes sp.]